VFTGIVEEVGRVVSAPPGMLTIAADVVLADVQKGDSMAVNGACLTVTAFDKNSFSVEVMPETLVRTNLGLLRPGDGVNLERPLTPNSRLGGHFVQGHIDDTARLSSIGRNGDVLLLRFDTPSKLMPYIVEKGFIALDGVSLTVISRDDSSFQVSIVGYTREHTILGERRVGDVVNLEVDIIAKYVEQLNRPQSGGITLDFLQEHGFLVG
jgi:riboflavin synthase